MDFSALVPRAVDYFPGEGVQNINPRTAQPEPLPSPAEIAELGVRLKHESKTATELTIRVREIDASNVAIKRAIQDRMDNESEPEPNPLDSELWNAWYLSRLRQEALPRYLAAHQESRAELCEKLSRLVAWMSNGLRHCDHETRAKYQRILSDAKACL